jgi:acetyltransferase-like isoleucine patch superfamily enzyme
MKYLIKKTLIRFLSFFGYEIHKKKEEVGIDFSYLDDEPLIYDSQLSGNIKVGKRSMLYKVRLSGEISIGCNTTINGPGTEFYALKNPITIGNFCSIARNTAVQEHNHDLNNITTYYIKQRIFREQIGIDAVSKGAIIIGNDVWIGTQSIILSGVTIGDGCVITANSVVTKNIPPYSIAGGSPAKVIRQRFSEDIIEKLLVIKWWNWDIEKIKRNYNLFHGELTIEKLENIAE